MLRPVLQQDLVTREDRPDGESPASGLLVT